MMRRLRRVPLAFPAILAVVCLLVAGLVFAFVTLDGRLADRDRTIDALASGLDVVRQQVEAEGKIPAAPPADQIVQGAAGPVGPPGRPPTPDEVAAAVAAFLTANPPQPGRPPTADEIANAVAVFCGNDRCAGPAGASGSAGATGTQGPAGPAPSDQQVASSVAAYCAAHDGCRGPAGADGQAPASFSFTFLAITYQCTDPDGDRNYTCS